MFLTHLSLSNFRNFTRLDLDVPSGSILIVGSNAQGKTSLLEAIFYLATFESFHATQDKQLVNFLAAREPLAVARIVMDFQPSDAGVAGVAGVAQVGRKKSHHLEIRLIQKPTAAMAAPGCAKKSWWTA